MFPCQLSEAIIAVPVTPVMEVKVNVIRKFEKADQDQHLRKGCHLQIWCLVHNIQKLLFLCTQLPTRPWSRSEIECLISTTISSHHLWQVQCLPSTFSQQDLKWNTSCEHHCSSRHPETRIYCRGRAYITRRIWQWENGWPWTPWFLHHFEHLQRPQEGTLFWDREKW